jgi:hypothetical protein
VTSGGSRRGDSLRAGPGRKSSVWRAASFLVAWGVVLMLWPWITPDVVHLEGLGRLGIALAVLGFLTSIPYALDWMRGHLAERPAPPREMAQVREVEGSGGSTYVVLAPPPVVEAPDGTGSRTLRVKEVSAGWYVAYVLLWRGPVALGDALLAAVWNGIGAFRGRRGDEGLGLRSSPLDGSFELADAEERSRTRGF